MESEAIARINAFLAHHGASVDTLSKQKVCQFEKVDAAIQARLEEIHRAQETLRRRSISVSAIALDAGIARKTFYNNELLRLFVEEQVDALDEQAQYARDAAALREKCEDLERQVKLFLLRDIETESLRHENMKMQIENQNLLSRITSLEEQCEKLHKDYATLQRKTSTGASIIPFNKQT